METGQACFVLANQGQPEAGPGKKIRVFDGDMLIKDPYTYDCLFYQIKCITVKKETRFLLLFAIAAAGALPCDGRITFPRTSSQYIFCFWTLEIFRGIGINALIFRRIFYTLFVFINFDPF